MLSWGKWLPGSSAGEATTMKRSFLIRPERRFKMWPRRRRFTRAPEKPETSFASRFRIEAHREAGLKTTGTFAAVFAAVQAAVAALIVRAVHRIGGHVLADRWLWIIAFVATVAQLTGVHFAITLVLGGIAYVLAKQG